MTRHIKLAALATLLLASAAAADPLTITGTARIVDADTIFVDGVQIRIQGLDAEEMSMTNGPKATAVMREIVGDHVITCKPDGTRTRQRVVATCFLPDGTDIARALVRQGWALDCARYSLGRYRADEPKGVREKLQQARYC